MTRAVCGGCNCGAVRYEAELDPRGVSLCHCHLCRRAATGPLISLRSLGGVRLTQAESLVWWQSSDVARRGFCGRCGSQLFWSMLDAAQGDWTIGAGSLDVTPELGVYEHLFADCAAPWEALTEGVPHQSEAQMHAALQAYLAQKAKADAPSHGGNHKPMGEDDNMAVPGPGH